MNQNKLLLAILTASGLFFSDLARQSLILAQSDETKPTFEASNRVEEGIKANEGPGEASDTLAEKEVQSEVEDKPGGVSYPSLVSFKLIQERNIFDPDRRRPREMRRETPVAPPREESFTLLGTMSYGERILAFFEGTQRDWSGAVELGNEVAGHTLKEVGFDNVLLELKGEILALQVGAGRSKRGDADWETQDRDSWKGSSGGSRSGRSSRSSSSSTFRPARPEDSADAASASADGGSENAADKSVIDGSASDILKQMMERRRQQVGEQ
tara:strand:- start:24 stop:833 length:810 start_codon:yes stop_codon:yes gene_type:complete